jgi:hypothetical protein
LLIVGGTEWHTVIGTWSYDNRFAVECIFLATVHVAAVDTGLTKQFPSLRTVLHAVLAKYG